MCRQGVADIWHILRPMIDTMGLTGLPQEQVVAIVMNANVALRRYTNQQVWEAILELSGSGGSADEQLPVSRAEQLVLERTAIVEGRSDADVAGSPIFDAKPVAREDIAAEAPRAHPVIASLVLLHRLREVRALRGFQRLGVPGAADPYTSPCAPLSREALNWLPAIEVYGEGVYFELDSNRLEEWSHRAEVSARVMRLQAKRDEAFPESAGSPLTPQFLLIHTLAHLLINQLALDCGYSSSSLRERIYVGANASGDEWAGALIYTATASSDGTLGGLVRQGQPRLFGQTLQAAIENATWCSSDPLCIESAGQGIDALNLAACHACAIVSETSCEHRNVLLDRALVVGTPDAPELGFFCGTALMESQG
jgi:hypothetical protein